MLCANKKCAVELPDGAIFCHLCGKKQASESRKRLKRANGSGTVYKLSGRRRRPWVAAKGGVILDYYETKTAALEAVNELVKKPVNERYNMTFKEVYESWKKEHFRDIGPKGEEGYENAYNHFAPLHARKFRDLRAEHYQDIIDELIGKGRSHSTTNKLKQLAGQMSKWAMREEMIPTNYAQFIRLQENTTAEKDTFTDEDVKKLKDSRDDAAKIVLMLIYTGMRIGELFALPVDAVHENYCVGGEKTDAGKNRIIPIPSNIREHFQYFLSRAEPGGLLLSGYEGEHNINNFRNRDYYPLLKSLGISKKSPHSTRHTYASMAVKLGIKPEILQKILGHADYSTTSNIYVHADVDALVKAAERLTTKKTKNKTVANTLLTEAKGEEKQKAL